MSWGPRYACKSSLLWKLAIPNNPVIYLYIKLSTLLTYSMVQSPSWAANWFAASQEIPRISRNPNVHYRTHKRTPLVSVLGQPKPVHMPTSHLLEMHHNVIHPSTPRSPQWSPSLRFPPPRPYTLPSSHPYVPHAQLISFFSSYIGLPKCGLMVVFRSANWILGQHFQVDSSHVLLLSFFCLRVFRQFCSAFLLEWWLEFHQVFAAKGH